MHGALFEQSQSQSEDDLGSDDGSKSEEDPQSKALFALFESHVPPVASLNQVNTLLEHPDFSQLNEWMDSGTENLCLNWADQERRLNSNKFDLSASSSASQDSRDGECETREY